MNTEEDEFNRIEREAAMRKPKHDDDDTQDYVRPWVDLTDEELDKLAVDAGIITWVRKVYDNIDRKFYDLPLGEGMTGDAVCLKQFARLVEEALRKKNS